MRKSLLYVFAAASFVFTCKNIDTADPSPRSTFIKFFEGPKSMQAVAVEKIPAGYVMLANTISSSTDASTVQTVLIETDENGNRIGDYHLFNDITAKSFKPVISNGAVSGYIIVGDRIEVDPTQQQAANVLIYSMSVLILNSSFEEAKDRIYISDKNTNIGLNQVKDDYYGGSVNLTGKGGAIVLGTFKAGSENQQSAPAQQLLFGLDAGLDSSWVKYYPLLSNTYDNAKSIHYSNGNIIWASAVADVQGDFTSSYLTIPFVKEQSVPINFSTFLETTPQLLLPKDIQPASSTAFGYGVVGTYSESSDGSKGNMFFLRVGTDGTIIQGSDRYFDGLSSLTSASVDKNTSEIIDSGEAIASTSDGGFVLAGTIETSPEKGNGGKDILLVKVNAVGDLLWIKTMGGTGDEVPAGITEASNGDLIICGTNNLNDYASVFLMRTDKNGELKN